MSTRRRIPETYFPTIPKRLKISKMPWIIGITVDSTRISLYDRHPGYKTDKWNKHEKTAT